MALKASCAQRTKNPDIAAVLNLVWVGTVVTFLRASVCHSSRVAFSPGQNVRHSQVGLPSRNLKGGGYTYFSLTNISSGCFRGQGGCLGDWVTEKEAPSFQRPPEWSHSTLNRWPYGAWSWSARCFARGSRCGSFRNLSPKYLCLLSPLAQQGREEISCPPIKSHRLGR